MGTPPPRLICLPPSTTRGTRSCTAPSAAAPLHLHRKMTLSWPLIGTNFALRVHCGCIAGAMREHVSTTTQSRRREETSSNTCGCSNTAEQSDVWDPLFLQFQIQIATMQRHTRGANVQMTCATIGYSFITVSTVVDKHRHHFSSTSTRACSSIKNKSLGSEDDQIPS